MGSKYMVGINLVSDEPGARGALRGKAVLVVLAACLGCSATQPDRPKEPASVSAPSQQSETSAAEAAERPVDPEASSAPSAPATFACAQVSCTTYATPGDALAAALPANVRIVGFGEAHAPSGYVGRSTARRFAEDLLPGLAPRSKRLLVELLAPPTGCEKAREDVQTESQAITEGQAETNQNDYLELGHAARRLGITPDILRPSCQDMQAIAAAEIRVLAIMETIATLSVDVTKTWLAEATEARSTVLLYGGALHNDLAPRQHLETWSYGPRLSDLSGGLYVEIDLVIPELMQDSESWQKFPWYQAVRSLPPEHGPTLVQVSAGSFALVFEPSRK